MLRFTCASVTALTLALLVPGVAGAIPISFDFSGVVTDASAYVGVANGDPFTATLSYDTDTPIDFENTDLVVYAAGSFELHVGGHSWFSVPSLLVHKSGFTFVVGNSSSSGAYALLSGFELLPPGGALPTALDLAAMTFSREVQGVSTIGRLYGEITSITQTQGPDLVAAPEPATLTLSAFGLAALLARRRRGRRQ